MSGVCKREKKKIMCGKKGFFYIFIFIYFMEYGMKSSNCMCVESWVKGINFIWILILVFFSEFCSIGNYNNIYGIKF